MNMLQRNPRDPKHLEYHDGEYEYWPTLSPASSKSSTFPAALLNGLELIAAAVASALLALALLTMYTLSSPHSIAEEHAVIHVNVYNNTQDLEVWYTLTFPSAPDHILEEGMLAEDSHTLQLYDLTPGTQYLLQYFSQQDGELVPIGDFPFTTPGQSPGPSAEEDPASGPESGNDSEVPSGIPEATGETEEAAEETTEETQMETNEDPTQETDDDTEDPSTKPTKPPAVWYPPSDDSENQDPSTPETQPSSEPTVPPVTVDPNVPPPEAITPEIAEVTFVKGNISGLVYDRYVFSQLHYIKNVPDGGYESIQVTHNGKPVTTFTPEISHGALSVLVEGLESILGAETFTEETVTTVTVNWANGTTTTSTQTVRPPSITSTALDVTKNADGTHTFTVTVTTDPGTGEFGIYFGETDIHTTQAEPVVWNPITMEKISVDTYVGSYTEHVTPHGSSSDPQRATVVLAAIWDQAVSSDPANQSMPDTYLAEKFYSLN